MKRFSSVYLFLLALLIYMPSMSFSQGLNFVKNNGQVHTLGLDNEAKPLYTFSCAYYNVQFYKDHYAYHLFSDATKDSILVSRVEMWFEDAVGQTELLATNKSNSYTNFYKNNASHTNISAFNSLTYKNVWNGVDIHFYVKNGDLKFDYIIQPEAENGFKINVKGADVQANDGVLSYTSKAIHFDEEIPESYWISEGKEKRPYKGINLEVENGTISYTYVSHREKTLVIDPVIYSEKNFSYYGGIQTDFLYDMELFSNGDRLIGGYTFSLNNIATVGAYQQFVSDIDAYIAKFDAQGNRIWATYFGGTDQEQLFDFAINSLDEIIITGNTSSISGIATPGAYQTTLMSMDDAYLAKFDQNGQLIWGTYFGGNDHDFIAGVTTDINDKIIITGHSTSSNYPLTVDAFTSNVTTGIERAIVAAFNTNGALLFSSLVGDSTGSGRAVVSNNVGEVFFVGETSSNSDISSGNSFQNSFLGVKDAFIMKLGTNYQPVWGTYNGGFSEDIAVDLALDNANNILVVGHTSSDTLISSVGAFQELKSSYEDAFILKFDSAGNKLWGTYSGANGTDYLNAIDIENNEIWVSGYSTSTNGFSDSTSLQPLNNGGYDNILLHYDLMGNQIWSSFYGGNGDDFSNCLIYIDTNKILLGGYTNSMNLATVNAHQNYYGGGSADGFIAEICKPLFAATLNYHADTILCQGSTLNLQLSNVFDSYLWNSGSVSSTVSITESGQYWVNTVDSSGCPNHSDTIFVQVIKDTISLNYAATVFCFEDSVLISVDSGFVNYNWNQGTNNFNQYIVSVGSYWCEVTDSNNCLLHSDTVTITTNTNMYTIGIVGSTTICAGGEAILYVDPNLHSYHWSSSEQTPSINVSNQGLYSVTALDANNCPVISDTVEIFISNFQNQFVHLDTSGLVDICLNDTLTLGVDSAFVSYLWSSGETTETIDLTQSNAYFVSVTDSNNCVSISDTLSLSFYQTITPSIYSSNGTSTFCVGDSLLLLHTELLTDMMWNTNTVFDSLWITNGGLYSFTASDTNNCASISDTILISENVLPEVDISIIDNPLMCSLYPVVLQSTEIDSYWSNSDFMEQIEVESSGSYWCYVQDTNGCLGYSDTVLVTFNNPTIANITIEGPNPTFCIADELDFKVTNYLGFKSIYWEGQTTSANYTTGLDSSRYVYVQLKDNYNCITTDSVYVEVVECPEQVNLVSPNPADKSCEISSETLINSISVFDDNGKLVTKLKDIESFSFELNTILYESGNYYIQINEAIVFKLIVIHK